ncbi:hypothetical protein FPJ27_14680 [Burkholderia sp. MS455]|uniref:TfuA-like protein n=1 Tax=Burkholderia sp. MS455 TaxID=2811788 RepID=UPI00195D0E2C|nr:TfuA-like protein [Burkholderia sp. MS455]QRR07548.1 hypothetical protein FPJ27_14680 [Burkholderia sp. MS455]
MLITDGVFGESMAVSPCECMDLLHAGWLLLGASSMGALRAADCNRVGMIGIGEIYFGFKLGYYHSDADVAVLYQPATHNERTISLAQADWIIRHFAQEHSISGPAHHRLLRDLRAVPWFERHPQVAGKIIAHHFGMPALCAEFLSMWQNPTWSPKARDALLACDQLFRYFLKRTT